ncbi:MBL fold metallo-hydrolase [Pectobacterium brasiliense]|uniref:MBL fold metallo-hydrolase n=1 Tax=Pectobacterium brasiliense TaxID=180957 RepID=UPI00227A1BC0|nr:MBL fold metallo-hydrolase [Pectobacterium brasiliense]WGL29759.1 MBL fold metallo-hydrolase [Pectobacterium brasiliense]
MKITTLASGIAFALSIIVSGANAESDKELSTNKSMKQLQMQEIRNATVKFTYANITFLVDPMFAKKGTYPGFENTYRSHLRNPLVELPLPVQDVMKGVDAVIVTHTHLDHWDPAAQELLPKDIPLFVQNKADQETIRSQGFTDVRVLDGQAIFGDVKLSKTGGQHGTDKMFSSPPLAEFLGEAMGIVLESPGYKTVYLVGDTIWRPEVDNTIKEFSPDVIVLNAGYARVNDYDGAIIMGKDDVLRAVNVAPKAKIVAVHMDAINHMGQNRKELREFIKEKGIESHVDVPEDGAVLAF